MPFLIIESQTQLPSTSIIPLPGKCRLDGIPPREPALFVMGIATFALSSNGCFRGDGGCLGVGRRARFHFLRELALGLALDFLGLALGLALYFLSLALGLATEFLGLALCLAGELRGLSLGFGGVGWG